MPLHLKVIRIVGKSPWSNFVKIALFSFNESKGHLAHFPLSPHIPRPIITPLSPHTPHSHHKLLPFTENSSLSHHPLSPHTPTLSPHNTLSHNTTHSPLSHHTTLLHTHPTLNTLLTLSPHHSVPLSHHTIPSLTTHSHIIFLTTSHTLHFHFTTLSHHSLSLSYHTTHSPLSQHTTRYQLSPHHTTHSPFSHRILSTISLNILHFLAAHSPLSYLSPPTTYPLTSLLTLSPYHTIPTLYHTSQSLTSLPTFVPVSSRISFHIFSPHTHSRTSLPILVRSLISLPTLGPHFITAHSHIHYAHHSLTTLFHFSLYSSLSPHSQSLTLYFLISLLILSQRTV